MIKVLKASAGSGKTYRLAKEYIRLLLESGKADAYRHILAVTFTNKATDEMKRRILKELNTLSREPEQSKYLKDLQDDTALSVAEIQARARQQLSGILHDYSSFAVSTIDRFFQQTLRAFSREIGQFSSYQVQLDREALVTESVDRVLDGLGEEGDRELLDWITLSVQEDLRESGRLSLEEPLQEVATSLSTLPEGKDSFPRERLKSVRKDCEALTSAFRQEVSEAAKACLKALEEAGVDPQDSDHHFLASLYNYTDPDAFPGKPTDSFLKKASDPERWFPKSRAHLLAQLHGALDEPLARFAACFAQPYKEYKTACTIQGQLYSLGVAGELREAFTQIQREKNLLSLDDSNTILKGIIDGADAPFIYEKLGVRFDDFLLDEFQDTSDIQWDNFRPLVRNSESGGHPSLVVGDVKQSIYRWRGSDWSLLGERLEKEFGQVKTESLQQNWRSCAAIVQFNSDFFAYAAAELDRLNGTSVISRLYADVKQESKVDDSAPGSVQVDFVEDEMAEILETLSQLRSRGAAWSDIAILVRGNAEGSDIAAALVAEGIPVVSDDSLFVKSSVTVRRLVSQLSLVEAPPDESQNSADGYLARSMDVNIPAGYHSLVDLSESLLRDIREAAPEVFDAEVPYIQSFMDNLSDWVSTGGNNLNAFLKAWDAADPKIASPQLGNSVRVMTIHKAKGLEFPFVLVPFAEKVTLYKADTSWYSPAAEGTALEKEADSVYLVQLDSGAADSLFEEDYYRERVNQSIDNLNVFYVALTRAKNGLKVIASLPPKNTSEPKNLSQVLYNYVGGLHYEFGEPYDPRNIQREKADAEALEATYASYPANSGERLRVSPEAADYFGEDGSFGPEASSRIRGSVLHDILSRVRVPGDLPGAVRTAVLSGELPASVRDESLALLQERIASVEARGWFAPEARVLNEATVIAPGGGEYRPDRVVLKPDGSVDIVDYKFGARKEAYQRQVQRYVRLYQGMGYEKVTGYLWYLEDNFITFVS